MATNTTSAGLTTRPRSGLWAGYAAAAWAFLFAAQSFYHAAGGTMGVETIGPAIAEPVLAGDTWWIAALWITGALKILGGLLALALVRPWGRVIPHRLLLIAAWGAAVVLGLYKGVASLVQHGLMVAGVIDTPAGLGSTAARWHLILWDPWWLLGGILFAAAAWSFRRRSASRTYDR